MLTEKELFEYIGISHPEDFYDCEWRYINKDLINIRNSNTIDELSDKLYELIVKSAIYLHEKYHHEKI